MSRRNKAEIVLEILELCITPVRKTEIVYKCNLNFKIVKKYLEVCFSNGWLQKIDKKYQTTTIGMGYLDILMPVVYPLKSLKF